MEMVTCKPGDKTSSLNPNWTVPVLKCTWCLEEFRILTGAEVPQAFRPGGFLIHAEATSSGMAQDCGTVTTCYWLSASAWRHFAPGFLNGARRKMRSEGVRILALVMVRSLLLEG